MPGGRGSLSNVEYPFNLEIEYFLMYTMYAMCTYVFLPCTLYFCVGPIVAKQIAPRGTNKDKDKDKMNYLLEKDRYFLVGVKKMGKKADFSTN